MPKGETLRIHNPNFEGRTLTCLYSYNGVEFQNNYIFPGNPTNFSSETLKRLTNWVAIVSALGLFSVEYFDYLKTDFELTDEEAAFFEKLIFFGLGEFRYINKIAVNKKVKVLGKHLETKPSQSKAPDSTLQHPLLLNGGGKDGSVSALLLGAAGINFTWFQRGNSVAQDNVRKQWNAPAIIVERQLDPKRMNRKYSGHRPMSAGIAFLAVLSAYLYGFDSVIASNELSANEGNFTLEGFLINHQYSKSMEFENDIQTLLTLFGIEVSYFSALRPLHELQIALIAAQLEDKQLAAITSCNNGTKTGKWCLKCPKCAFVVLTITAASNSAAEEIWGYQVINNPSLLPYLKALLDPKIDKPFECVGTLDECQLAAYLILQNKQLALEKPLLALLNRFASGKNIDLLYKLSESLIPKPYEDVLKQIQIYLDRWNTVRPN